MAGRFKSALSFIGEMAEATYDHNQKIDEMTRELMRHGYNLDVVEVRKIARVLVNHADVTWK